MKDGDPRPFWHAQLRPRNPTCPSTFPASFWVSLITAVLSPSHRPANKSLRSHPGGGLIRGPIKKRGPKEPLIYRSGSWGRTKQLLSFVPILAPCLLQIKINAAWIQSHPRSDVRCFIFGVRTPIALNSRSPLSELSAGTGLAYVPMEGTWRLSDRISFGSAKRTNSIAVARSRSFPNVDNCRRL